jgi:dimeric dUTPase (all-alpha-NTP-PPase superfamily)
MEAQDKLQTIFEMQKALNDDIRERRHLEGISSEQWIQRHMLAMFAEMAEVLDEVNYKWWKNPKPADPDALREELVDVLHFFVSMCLEAGMDADDLFRRYLAKNEENFLRQQGKSEKEGYAQEL